ncbi:hypothetical protein ES708_20246 [subsurface metagenome]
MLPKNPLLTTAILAGPPLDFPASLQERLMKNSLIPVWCKNAPKITNTATKVAVTPVRVP